MLKTISAALLAVSVLAAPALAASADKMTPVQASKQVDKQVSKQEQVKSGLRDANARIGRHHRHYRRHRHHRFHNRTAAMRTHQATKLSIKHNGQLTKRG